MNILQTREITKEQFNRALKHNRNLAESDRKAVFTVSELCGYGIYDTYVFERNGRYYVRFVIGSSCD